ncbi:MAG: sugar phosphate isomerase/epimerase [Bryobacterales bacterium]|nr:sugar phosphate isomerase/epimerase [Bryobacterales bacterium]
MKMLVLVITAAIAYGADAPLFVFDNGAGRGEIPIEDQVELAKRTGYAGLLYTGTKDLARVVDFHHKRGMKLLGIYTGMNVSDATPNYDPGLPEAIKQMKGSGALITFTVNGKAANGDEIAVPVLRRVANMAAQSGIQVALYPHHGFHVARIEDALRLIAKIERPNVGVVFNLFHWLRSGDGKNLQVRLKEALPHLRMVSISGSDEEGDWDRLIQPLDRGSYDVQAFVRTVRSMGFKGPIGLQCYNIKGNREENLVRSMKAWRAFR